MKNCFSKRLYIEGLTRVRTPGIITAVLTVLFAVATPLTDLLNDIVSKPGASSVITVIGAKQLTSPLLLLLLATPFFALTSFSFLNKRNTSDFYHALPYTRVSIFVGFLLGILTWIGATALVSVSLRSLLYALSPRVVVQFGAGLLGTLSYIIGCMVLLGYVLLALSLTGTRFSNVAVFLVLFGLPRYCLSTFWETLETLVPLIDTGSLPYTLFSKNYALVQVLFNGSFSYGSSNLFINPFMLLYHFVLAVGLFALGALAFQKRPSETAGNPATGRRAQHVWRLLVATPMAILAVSIAIETLVEGMEDPIVAVFASAFMLFLGAVTYLLYELFSAGKLRRVGDVAIRFLYIFIPIVLFAVLVLGARAIVLGRDIPLEDIKSVTFTDSYGDYGKPWEQYETDNLAITDPEILSLVQAGYEENLSALRDGTYPEKYYGWESKCTYVPVKITTKDGKTRTYNIVLSDNTAKYLQSRKFEIKEYLDAYLSLPDEKSVEYFLLNNVTFSDDMELYRAFTHAYENLSLEEKIAVKEGNSENIACVFYVSGTYKNTGGSFYSSYYISADMTELMKSIRLALNQSQWEGESKGFTTNMEAAKAVAEEVLEGYNTVDEYFYLDVTAVADGNVAEAFYYGEDIPQNSQVITALAQAILADDGSVSSPCYVILYFDAMIDGTYESFTVSVSVSEELADLIFAESEK